MNKEDTDNGFPKNTSIIDITIDDSGGSGGSEDTLGNLNLEVNNIVERGAIVGGSESISTVSTVSTIEHRCLNCGEQLDPNPYYRKFHNCQILDSVNRNLEYSQIILVKHLSGISS